jgi:hypothetical protein
MLLKRSPPAMLFAPMRHVTAMPPASRCRHFAGCRHGAYLSLPTPTSGYDAAMPLPIFVDARHAPLPDALLC